MVRRRVDEAAAAMGGSVSGDGRREWSGASLDSRSIAGGELFFALAGTRTDGHRFVADALARGAAAAVVQRGVEAGPDATLVRVSDATVALHDLTRWVRGQAPRRLVGITGSTGKTTTKELLAAMLGARYRVARSPGNLNNLLGFPLALLAIPDDTEWMVAELGMSVPGELRAISLLARPDVALYTNVRPVHLEFFGTLRSIAAAKAELLAGLPADGLVVANADDAEVRWIAGQHRGRIVWYGRGADAEMRLGAVETAAAGRPGSRFVLHAGGAEQPVELPLHGAYNVENCLAAAAGAWALGVPLEAIATAAAAARPAPMRGVVERLPGEVTLVDDSYNSNPAALEQALRAAARLPAARRWAVLGDMLELGPQAPAFHREAGRLAAALGFAPVAGVGELARELQAAAGAAGRWFSTAAEAAAWTPEELRQGDLVLVKGSRGVGLEGVSEAVRRAARERG